MNLKQNLLGTSVILYNSFYTFFNNTKKVRYMKKNWIKFDDDDGADVFYNINDEEKTVDLKIISPEGEKEMLLFFEEVKEVYDKIKNKI